MKKLIALVVLGSSSWAQAHPVSFQNSFGVMGHHSPGLTHNQLNYSFKYWFAFGVHHFRRPLQGDQHANFGTLNFLLKRWNSSALQANLYAVAGAGQSRLSGQSQTKALGLLQFDIEDRHYYFLSKHLQILDKNRQDLRQTTFRAGITPYVDPYEGLHSWIILEWQKTDFIESSRRELTPFLRVFYRNILFEIGQSFNGTTKINYISHF